MLNPSSLFFCFLFILIYRHTSREKNSLQSCLHNGSQDGIITRHRLQNTSVQRFLSRKKGHTSLEGPELVPLAVGSLQRDRSAIPRGSVFEINSKTRIGIVGDCNSEKCVGMQLVWWIIESLLIVRSVWDEFPFAGDFSSPNVNTGAGAISCHTDELVRIKLVLECPGITVRLSMPL